MKNEKFGTIAIVIVLIIAIVGVGIWSFMGKKTTTQLTGENVKNIEVKYSETELDSSWDKQEAIEIVFSDSNITSSNTSMVSVDGNVVTIKSAGEYHLTGKSSNAQVIVEATKDDEVQLVLDNLDLTCTNSAPIFVKKADEVIITLENGSTNNITDGEKYELDENEEPNAAIFSKEDLVINGTGTLNVTSNYEDGIASKDDLKIISGTININADDDGIRGKDSVVIKDGTINIVTGGGSANSSKSNNNWGEWNKDSVNNFKNKSFDSTDSTNTDGNSIQLPNGDNNAQTPEGNGDMPSKQIPGQNNNGQNGQLPNSNNGTTPNGQMPGQNGNQKGNKNRQQDRQQNGQNQLNNNITTQQLNNSSNVEITTLSYENKNSVNITDENQKSVNVTDLVNTQTNDITIITTAETTGNKTTNVTTSTTSTTESTSAKGIKAGKNITITGGNFTLDTSDDSIHSNGTIGIAGGNIKISSGDDGIHADESLVIDNGYINIEKSYEGLESSTITINDGEIYVVASDDGVNVAGGNDGSSINGRPGQNNMMNTSSNSSNILTINGGYVYVNATGDGLDANGSGYINGGTIIVNGPTDNGNAALDYDGTFEVNGGLLIAAGSSGMLQTASSSSKINCISITFNSTQQAGSLISIVDSNNNEVITFAPSKTYQSVVICSENFKTGETYKVYSGGTSSKNETNGLYENGGYEKGELVTEVTVNSTVTTYGSNGMENGQGGNMRGGNRQDGNMQGNPGMRNR